jgi:hypothetical protein
MTDHAIHLNETSSSSAAQLSSDETPAMFRISKTVAARAVERFDSLVMRPSHLELDLPELSKKREV